MIGLAELDHLKRKNFWKVQLNNMALKKYDSASHAYKNIVVISRFAEDCFAISY